MANIFAHNKAQFHSGDLIRLHQKIVEGDKERTQVFEGMVIGIKGSGENQMITVRKLAIGNIGVEKIVAVNSPWITKIELKKPGTARRAKLYFLREKTRRQTREITQTA